MSKANENKKSQAVHEGDRKFTDLQSRVRTLENLCYSAKEVLNLEEAASFLGIAKSTLYKMTHENRIPFYKPAGKLIEQGPGGLSLRKQVRNKPYASTCLLD